MTPRQLAFYKRRLTNSISRKIRTVKHNLALKRTGACIYSGSFSLYCLFISAEMSFNASNRLLAITDISMCFMLVFIHQCQYWLMFLIIIYVPNNDSRSNKPYAADYIKYWKEWEAPASLKAWYHKEGGNTLQTCYIFAAWGTSPIHSNQHAPWEKNVALFSLEKRSVMMRNYIWKCIITVTADFKNRKSLWQSWVN